ncbi:MAG: 8-oxo-dGTP diphosphatase [Verrucomicrobia bacterium]|nr:8-oxo-dGTP diphosphatase [Verrucomicrobiota bacterium]
MSPSPVGETRERVDGANWKPQEKGTLCFIIENGKILLIEKKRGLGAGKVNGPGGRIEVGETAEQGAIRETQEEVGLTPTGMEWAGELSFQFRDGYSLHVELYRASGWTGELCETDEAKPFWCSTSEIPYGRMWADDEQWMPRLLAGEKFRGWFEFDGDRMEWFRMEVA